MAKYPDCIFCKIISGEIPVRFIAENDTCVAMLDAFPATKGHALILTKEHRRDLLEMTTEELADCSKLMSKVASAAKNAFGCDGINFINNLGVAAGQRVMHSHFHVIPRYENDGVSMEFKQVEMSGAEKDEIIHKIMNNLG
ncbi:MAG TPA: HIT family protein [bacterium]|nr:HIT family protein [bacterium]